MRTGVTAILPRRDHGRPQPVSAGFFALNGNGEMTGVHWVNDAGYFLGPVLITNTHGIGACHHGATEWMIRTYDRHFTDDHAWAMPIVAETYDGCLNDINALHVRPEHAVAALEAATGGPVAEGSVGGGNGMIAYEFKAGTGTASRRIRVGGQTYAVAALVQANYGRRDWFTVLGVPVGRHMPLHQPFRSPPKDSGSIIVILATDAPLSDALLRGLAKRAALGIGRSGSPGGNSSGDIFLAFSTADPMPDPLRAEPVIARHSLNWEEMDAVYEAAVQAVDESVINAIVQGEDTPCVKPEGAVCPGIDTADLCRIVRAHLGSARGQKAVSGSSGQIGRRTRA
jgi:D-aminopeptidase